MVKPEKKHHIKVAGMQYSAIRYAFIVFLGGADTLVDSVFMRQFRTA